MLLFVCSVGVYYSQFILLIMALVSCASVVIGCLIHDTYINYTVFPAEKWYDKSGKQFFDLRRISEIVTATFIASPCVFSFTHALSVVLYG